LDEVNIRPATQLDAEPVAKVYLASRKVFLSYAPLAHSDRDVRGWIADHLTPSGGVAVAVRSEAILGMMATSRDEGAGWIDQLYLAPSAVGNGLGTRFVERAKRELGSPVRLYTFQANASSRRFYEGHGFRVLELGDGSGNEEHCPDALYEWTLPNAPAAGDDVR
jgi:GNAT superfamily N-acetyltransferase